MKIYSTIRKNGRFYILAKIDTKNGLREVSIIETTAEKAFETLARVRETIDKIRK